MADRTVKWRMRLRFSIVIFSAFINIVNGYEDLYTISQLSPKSIDSGLPYGVVLQTNLPETIDFTLESSGKSEDNHEDETSEEDIYIQKDPTPEGDFMLDEKERDNHIVARSINPNRESRSINIDEMPLANNYEIDNDIELHNKRKYYDIQPTKTLDYLHTRDDDEILMSDGFGDRLEFRFPGEAKRVPKARAIMPPGPKLHPTAVQPIFATASFRDKGRQNTEIQNIITGIVKLLNGNVNVQANSQLLNGRPGRPMASRINNRGPPRISDLPPLPPDFDKPITPPSHTFHPTKTPPPYPFDRPPHVGINLPEQIVPPISMRPGFHRPLPPWQRPRPRPPARRPNPSLPMYKPMPPLPLDLPEIEEPEEVSLNENESQENNIHNAHQDEKDTPSTVVPGNSTETEDNKPTTTTEEPTTTSSTTETTTTTTTTEKQTTTTEKETTTTEKLTTTTEKPESKPQEKVPEPEEQQTKPEKQQSEPVKEIKPIELVFNITDTKLDIKDNISNIQPVIEIQTSIEEDKLTSSKAIAAPTPTEGLLSHSPPAFEPSRADVLKTSSINTQPLLTSQPQPYHPYRRPGIVLDDTDFKRHQRPTEAPVITADTRLPGYGEIFDVTVSAIQGPGEKGASVHIENVNSIFGQSEHDDIIVSASGDQGFVSIDGKRTYLNLFDTSTALNIKPSRVQGIPHSVPPLIAPPIDSVGTGVAIPADDVPPRRPAGPGHGMGHGHGHGNGHGSHGPPQPQVPNRPLGYKRPQPTVRIDTCIVGDDSTCDLAQNEKCRTEAGISSCQCRPGYARRTHRDPCRRVVSLLLDLRVDRLYDRKIVWDNKLADRESDVYQQLSYEAVRAIDSAFSMTPFSDEFVGATVNSVHRGDTDNLGVFINYTVLMQETAESLRTAITTDIQKHLLGVIRRRSNNIGASALWVETPAGSVMPLRDVDECSSSDLNDCHELATCFNTWGAFRCTCPGTTLDTSTGPARGRNCKSCDSSHCNERGVCQYSNGQPYCMCNSGYYGSSCATEGAVVGAAVGACLAAALVIAGTLAALRHWSRKWSREQKARGMGSPVFNYMAANTIKTPPVGQPPYQISIEERMRWAQVAEAMAQAQANHYAQPEPAQMATRPSSAMFGGYPTLPPVPMPRMIHGLHTGTLNTVTSRANTSASHHNLYGYTNHMATDSTSSEASSHVQDRADLLVPRPKSRARSMHNQTGIYYDVDYENAPEAIYGTKGIPLSTYTMSRGPPFYRN